VLTKEAVTAPATVERLAYNPLDRRTLFGVLEYVLRQTGNDVLHGTDARFGVEIQLQHLIAASGGGVGQAAVSQLVEMLAQLGFKIKVPTGTAASDAVAQTQQTLASMPAGQTGTLPPTTSYVPSDKPTLLEVSGQTYKITVRPANALPDLNRLAEGPLQRYLNYLGMKTGADSTLAQLILNWRGDPDRPAISSEAEAWYAGREQPYSPHGRPILDWDELYYLMNSSPDLVDFLRQHFTLHGGKLIEARYASPAMVAVLADIPVEAAKRGLEKMVHPTDQDRDANLGDLIGVDNATRLQAVVGVEGSADTPVEVIIEGPKLILGVVYDRNTHHIVERLE
jgi:hypothetical protein